MRGGLASTGEGADQAGGDAAGAYREEVPIEIDGVPAAVSERASRGCGLADNHERDDGGDRGQAAQGRPGQPGHPDVGRVVGDVAEGRYAMGVQVHDRNQDRGCDEGDERGRETPIDQRPTRDHGQHT